MLAYLTSRRDSDWFGTGTHRDDMDGNFFEDFALGQQIRHATPRTITLHAIPLSVMAGVDPAVHAPVV